MEKREEGDDIVDAEIENFVDEGSDPHELMPVLLNTTDDFLKVLGEYGPAAHQPDADKFLPLSINIFNIYKYLGALGYLFI